MIKTQGNIEAPPFHTGGVASSKLAAPTTSSKPYGLVRECPVSPMVTEGFRLLVCGGRNFRDVPKLWKALDDFAKTIPEPGVRLVIEGASDDVTGPYIGADYWAHQWALARNIPHVRCHAKWGSAEGRAAGPIRNTRMLKEFAPHCVIAFPGAAGTSDMVRKSKAACVRTIEIISRPPFYRVVA